MANYTTTLYVVVGVQNVAWAPYVKVVGKHVHYREDVARKQMTLFNSTRADSDALWHLETETVVGKVWHVMCGTCGQEVDAMTNEGANNSHNDGAHFPSWYLEGDADRHMSEFVEGWE